MMVRHRLPTETGDGSNIKREDNTLRETQGYASSHIAP